MVSIWIKSIISFYLQIGGVILSIFFRVNSFALQHMIAQYITAPVPLKHLWKTWVKNISRQSTKNLTLTHIDWVTHLSISRWKTIFGSDNGLSPIWHQAITWTKAVLLWTGPLGTNFSEIGIKLPQLSFKKMSLKVVSKWWPFVSAPNVLT